MTYLSWAALHEGGSDALYFGVLVPRLMEAIIASDGIGHSDIPSFPAVILGKSGRDVDLVAAEICENRDAFHMVFVHADVGGAGLAQGLEARSTAYCSRAHEICGWPVARCVTVMPRHETEAWVLADPNAVLSALGYRGAASDVGLPATAAEAETLPDPKATLRAAVRAVAGRRRSDSAAQLFGPIAQRQSLEALRASQSFRVFEASLRRCLANLGCIPPV